MGQPQPLATCSPGPSAATGRHGGAELADWRWPGYPPDGLDRWGRAPAARPAGRRPAQEAQATGDMGCAPKSICFFKIFHQITEGIELIGH